MPKQPESPETDEEKLDVCVELLERLGHQLKKYGVLSLHYLKEIEETVRMLRS